MIKAQLLALAAPLLLATSTTELPNVWTCAADDNSKLCELAKEDQSDREPPIDWNKVTAQDASRKAAAIAILKDDKVRTPGDFFHAALIFQHGTDWEDFATAHLLSVRGLELAPTDSNLRRMVAASWDRMMHAQGRAQWFGTNTFRDNSGAALPKEQRVDRIPASVMRDWTQAWVWPESP